VSFEQGSGRLSTIQHRAGALSAPVASFSHAYDIRGNLAAVAELSATKRYSYDQIERLTGVTQQQGAAPATPAEAYTYDGEGNRVTSQITGAGGASTQTYVTDDRNRVTDDGVNTYTWTTSGALASRTPRVATASNAAITYEVQWHGIFNQMRVNGINSPGGGGGAEFYYDPFNRLMGVSYPDRPNTGNDRYLWQFLSGYRI
jgi:YD repeat-containing protein